METREWLGGAEGRVEEVARAALGEAGAVVGRWDAVALQSGVYRLTGTARVGAAERAWSVVLKVLVPGAGHDDPAHIRYWKREALLYGSGLLDDLPAGLRAPRCYGCDEPADGGAWLWLEDVREEGERTWPLARWALAARHLGQLNGAYLAASAGHRPLPRAPWLGGRRLRSWLERHVQLVPLIAAAPDDPGLRQWWPRPVVDAILRLWEERDALCAALERLPQTFCHGDAIRRNLLSRRGADGSEQTVGIDWEHAGQYAAGEEVGQTLSVAAAFFDLEPADLPALDEALFASYLDGLSEVGWRGDRRPVRFAYCAHAALRNGFNAVGASRPDEARLAAVRRSQGRSWEELAARRAAVRPFLLARAEEARGLVASL
jgi:hypothetical protein